MTHDMVTEAMKGTKAGGDMQGKVSVTAQEGEESGRKKDRSIVLSSFHYLSAPCIRAGSDGESVIWDGCSVLCSADTPGQGRYGTGGKGRRCAGEHGGREA